MVVKSINVLKNEVAELKGEVTASKRGERSRKISQALFMSKVLFFKGPGKMGLGMVYRVMARL